MKKTIVNIAPAVAETSRTKRVAAYARVSCGKDTMLHSLAAQIDYYRNYIMMNPEWRFAESTLTNRKQAPRTTVSSFSFS